MPARGDVTPSKRRKTKVQDKEKEDWDEESVVGAPAGGAKKKGPQAKDKKIGLVKKKRLVFVPSGRRSCVICVNRRLINISGPLSFLFRLAAPTPPDSHHPNRSSLELDPPKPRPRRLFLRPAEHNGRQPVEIAPTKKNSPSSMLVTVAAAVVVVERKTMVRWTVEVQRLGALRCLDVQVEVAVVAAVERTARRAVKKAVNLLPAAVLVARPRRLRRPMLEEAGRRRRRRR
jgi:hypothetical protein